MPREFRHIVRVAEADIDGTLKVPYAISNIKGIGINLAHLIVKRAGIDPETRIGFLSDEEIEKISDVIVNPSKYNIPDWYLNRRKDLETGKDLLLIGADLTFKVKTDIEKMKAMKSWRGYRHAYGLKVRGQRTRTTGRVGKAVGVKKKRRG